MGHVDPTHTHKHTLTGAEVGHQTHLVREKLAFSIIHTYMLASYPLPHLVPGRRSGLSADGQPAVSRRERWAEKRGGGDERRGEGTGTEIASEREEGAMFSGQKCDILIVKGESECIRPKSHVL